MSAAMRPEPPPPPTSHPDYDGGLDSVPLFMQTLPPEEEHPPALQAIQSLLFDDSPDSVADSFRERGNESYAERHFAEASHFYTQALEHPGVSPSLLRALHANRAACNLPLNNYGSCLRDCAVVLEAVPDDALARKALFRSCKALLALERLPEARDVSIRLLSLAPDDTEAKSLSARVSAKMDAATEKIHLQETRRVNDARHRRALHAALVNRGWHVSVPASDPPPNVDPPHFDIDALPPCSRLGYDKSDFVSPSTSSTPLVFPVFVLQPLADPPTRDFILSFNEQSTFAQNLDENYSFPYTLYVVSRKKRLLKLGRQLTLQKAALAALKQSDVERERDSLHLADGWAVEIYLIPSDRADKWAAELKQTLQK